MNHFGEKLLKNEQLFQYSNNLATKAFFKHFVQKRQNVTIDELIDDGGISKTTPIDLTEHVQRFYRKLYSCDQTNPLEQNFFLNNLKAGLSDQQKEHLQTDLGKFEIETAISQMAKGKAPGPDGLSVEFYTRCWPIVKNDFVKKLNQDTTSRRLIETEFLNYLTNNPTISLSMRSLQRPINDGGTKFPNPTSYCDLIYISNLFQYFKTREKNSPFNTETYLIEFEIGMSLSKLYDLPILNHIPDRDYRTPYYQKTLQILKEYKITLEELNKGKIKQIYYRISYPNRRHFHQETFRWKLVNQNILRTT